MVWISSPFLDLHPHLHWHSVAISPSCGSTIFIRTLSLSPLAPFRRFRDLSILTFYRGRFCWAYAALFWIDGDSTTGNSSPQSTNVRSSFTCLRTVTNGTPSQTRWLLRVDLRRSYYFTYFYLHTTYLYCTPTKLGDVEARSSIFMFKNQPHLIDPLPVRTYVYWYRGWRGFLLLGGWGYRYGGFGVVKRHELPASRRTNNPPVETPPRESCP